MKDPQPKLCQFATSDGQCTALICYANILDCNGRDKNGFPNYVFSGGSGEVKEKEEGG